MCHNVRLARDAGRTGETLPKNTLENSQRPWRDFGTHWSRLLADYTCRHSPGNNIYMYIYTRDEPVTSERLQDKCSHNQSHNCSQSHYFPQFWWFAYTSNFTRTERFLEVFRKVIASQINTSFLGMNPSLSQIIKFFSKANENNGRRWNNLSVAQYLLSQILQLFISGCKGSSSP